MRLVHLILLVPVILLANANAAFATKADYCSAYAHDFANSHAQDKTIWQHKYEIAMSDCLGETVDAQRTETTKTKPIVSAKKPQQKIASASNKIVKQSQLSVAGVKSQTKLEPGSEAWNNYCANKYASFNDKTGTYTSKTGVKRKCIVYYP